jgi:hypothetical protein
LLFDKKGIIPKEKQADVEKIKALLQKESVCHNAKRALSSSYAIERVFILMWNHREIIKIIIKFCNIYFRTNDFFILIGSVQ